MKTAREMFEELGFIIEFDVVDQLCWKSTEMKLHLHFFKDRKEIGIINNLNFFPIFNGKIIKAIYKQCEDLGWFDE